MTEGKTLEEQKQSFWKGLLLGCLGTMVVMTTAFSLLPAPQQEAELSATQEASAQAAQKLDEINALIDSSYLFDVDSEQMTDSMIKGYVAGLGDPYSAYYTAEEMEAVILNSEAGRQYLDWEQAKEKLPELNGEPWLKMIFVFRRAAAAVCAQTVLRQSSLGKMCDFSRSWPVGVEVLDKRATKGCAVRALRAMLPQISRVVCIGDYENDLSMLQEADLGVAVGNALEIVRQTADRVTVTNDENAIAALIDSL